MNSIVLIGVALAVFIMGYRFYAKFLTLGVLSNPGDAPTPANQLADGRDFMACGRFGLLLQHFAATVGLLSLPGIGIAVVWGWVPAFLWIAVGTLVAGGVVILGSMWASLRKSGESLASVAFDLTGMHGALALYFLGVLLLVLAAAVVCTLLGQLLNAHPEAVWAFLLLMPLTVAVARALDQPTRSPLWIGLALVLFVVGVTAGQWYPLALDGAWIARIRDTPILKLGNELLWAALALALAYRAAKKPVAAHTRPRGIALGALLALTMIAVLTGMAVLHPTITAPQIQDAAALPNPMMLLFLTVTGGALAGCHTLLVTGPTLRQLARRQDAPLVSYGPALAEGLVAVIVLTAIVAGIGGDEEWQALYGVWPQQAHMFSWLDLALIKLARFVAATGVPMPWAVGAVAAVFAGVGLVMLEQLFRALGFAIKEFAEDFELNVLKTPYFRERAAVVLVAAALLWLAQTELGLQQWLLLGTANQLFACSVLVILSLAVARLGRPSLFFIAPLALVLPFTVWGIGSLLLDWWRDGAWDLLAVGMVACLLGVTVLAIGLTVLTSVWRSRRAAPVPPGQ